MRNLARMTWRARKAVIASWPSIADCPSRDAAFKTIDRLISKGYAGDYDTDRRGSHWAVLVPAERLEEAQRFL